MKHVAILAALALAACGSETGNGTTAAAAPVQGAPAPAGASWTETVTRTAEGYMMGNPNAPIKLVEYGARTCPTCAAFARDAFRPLTENYVASGKVSFEFRDYLVHGAPDLALALLGTCGSAATFFPILEQTYANQSQFLDRLQAAPPAMQQALQGAAPTRAVTVLAEQMGAIDFVKQRGVPETQARACLSDQAKLEATALPTDNANKAGTVGGTPTFLLNGEVLPPNTISWPQVEQALKRAGA